MLVQSDATATGFTAEDLTLVAWALSCFQIDLPPDLLAHTTTAMGYTLVGLCRSSLLDKRAMIAFLEAASVIFCDMRYLLHNLIVSREDVVRYSFYLLY